MKNFFKKLSFVLAIAMVLTSIAPATASAAEISATYVPAKKVNLKVNSEKVTEVTLDVEETKTVKVGLPVTKAAKEAGFVKSTFKTWYSVADETVVDVVREGNRTYQLTGVAAGETTITINAAKTKKAAKNGKGEVATLTVVVNEKATEVSATQTGANKITVTGADLTTDKADYVIKRGITTLTIKEVTVNEEKTEAVIVASSSNLPKGDYTLSYKGGEAVAFSVEPAVVAEIVIDPEVAILNNSTTSAVAYYKVFDQFGDDVTKTSLGTTVKASGSDGADITALGTVTFNNNAGYTMNLSQVSLALVCQTNGVNASKILTVSEESKLAEVKFAGVYMNYAGTYVPAPLKEGMDDLSAFYLFFTGVDQYGMPTDVAAQKLQVNLSSITGINAGTVASATSITVNNVDYIAMPVSTTAPLRAGEVTMLSVVLNTGNTLKETITVEAATKIASLTIIADEPVYGNKKNTLSYEAVDTEGNLVTDFASLQVMNNANYLKDYARTGTGIRFERNNDGSAKLVYEAPSNTNPIAVPAVLTVQTPTMAFSTANISIQPNRLPQAIVGVADNSTYSLNLAATTNGSVYVTGDHLVFEDQYGNALYADEFTGYTVKVEVAGAVENMAITTGSALTTGVILTGNVNATTSAAVDVKVTLVDSESKEVTGSDYTFKVYSVNIDDVANLTIKPIGMKFAGTTFDAVVYGTYAGETVYLSANEYEVMNGEQNITVSVPAITNTIDTREATVNVLVKNTAGSIISAKYTYSNVARTISSVKATTGFVYGGNVISVASNEAVTAASLAAVLVVNDQYEDANGEDAEVVNEPPYVTLSELPTNIKATNNGRTDASVLIPTVGYHTIHVKYTWLNGYTFEQDVVVNVTVE